jgi:RNA polymerase sigma factor (sigma-70 family)
VEAAAIHVLPAQIRARRFERECEKLRPLGEAYVMRRFGGSLNRADAEDAVSDVVIRLHRRMTEGRAPDNLRATFFTSVRNAAIDQLRSRSAKPTVALEAAADAPTNRAIPSESAEDRDDAARLQEALGRMRENYREAIILRFGLGLTVPEISRHLKISLPAAKKLVLRATGQIRKRLESIEGQEFCPEMRQLAEQSLFEKEASGLANEVESEVLRAHFAHCGSCRSFVATLHDRLHELGSTALLGLTAADGATGNGIVDRIAAVVDTAGDAAQVGALKIRHLAFKSSGAFQTGEGAAGGALMGTGQKIVAACTAGAATATCVATGVVGPGIGAPIGNGQRDQESPPPKVRVLESSAPAPAPVTVTEPPVAPTTSKPEADSEARAKAASLNERSKARSEETQTTSSATQAQAEAGGEFGFEGAPAPSSSTAAPSTSTSTQSTSTSSPSPTSTGGGGGGSSGTSSGGSTDGSSSGSGETFGFGG